MDFMNVFCSIVSDKFGRQLQLRLRCISVLLVRSQDLCDMFSASQQTAAIKAKEGRSKEIEA